MSKPILRASERDAYLRDKWNDFHELEMHRDLPTSVRPHADTPPPMPLHPQGRPGESIKRVAWSGKWGEACEECAYTLAQKRHPKVVAGEDLGYGVTPCDVCGSTAGGPRYQVMKTAAQPKLPAPEGGWPRAHNPGDQFLWRGLTLDTNTPGMERIRALLYPHRDAPGEGPYGQTGRLPFPESADNQRIVKDLTGMGNPESFARGYLDELDDRGWQHPKLGQMILDYLEGGSSKSKGGAYWLGRHWTTDPHVALDWAHGPSAGEVKVMLKARHRRGEGLDPNKTNVGGSYPHEKEKTLLPGTPLEIHEVRVQHPRTYEWTNVLGEPDAGRTAMVSELPDHDWTQHGLGDAEDWAQEAHRIGMSFTGPTELPQGIQYYSPAGGTHGAQIYRHPTTGENWLVKPTPQHAPYLADVDVATSQLQSMSGLDAPSTFKSTEVIPGKVASIQYIYPGAKDAFPGKQVDPEKISDADLLEIQKHHALDWLIANHDSHPGQFIRTADGKLRGVDKGQAFKFFGKDQLGWNYWPNKVEMEPIYNTLYRNFAKGGRQLFDPRQGELAAYIQGLKDIPDDQYAQLLTPYAQGAYNGGELSMGHPASFLKAATARKNNLLNDFGKLYDKAMAFRTTGLKVAYFQIVKHPKGGYGVTVPKKDHGKWEGEENGVVGPFDRAEDATGWANFFTHASKTASDLSTAPEYVIDYPLQPPNHHPQHAKGHPKLRNWLMHHFDPETIAEDLARQAQEDKHEKVAGSPFESGDVDLWWDRGQFSNDWDLITHTPDGQRQKVETERVGRTAAAPDLAQLQDTGQNLGSHGSRIFRNPVTGEEWLFKKPNYGNEFLIPLDVATAQLQQMMGLPTAETHALPMKDYMVTAVKMFPQAQQAWQRPPHLSELSPEDRLTVQKHHVLDWLIANHDAHVGNWLRTPEHGLVAVDKGQALKYLGQDRLDWGFHPNYYARPPIHNRLWHEFAKGAPGELLDPREGELGDFVSQVQNIPDWKFRQMFAPYAWAAANAGRLATGAYGSGTWGVPYSDPSRGLSPPAFGANDPGQFLDALVARKKNLVNDLGAYYDKAATTRAAALLGKQGFSEPEYDPPPPKPWTPPSTKPFVPDYYPQFYGPQQHYYKQHKPYTPMKPWSPKPKKPLPQPLDVDFDEDEDQYLWSDS